MRPKDQYVDVLVIKHRANMEGTFYRGVPINNYTREELIALLMECLCANDYRATRAALSKRLWPA